MLGSPLTVTTSNSEPSQDPANRRSTVPDVTLDPLKAALADILWSSALSPTTLMTTVLLSSKHTVTNKGDMIKLPNAPSHSESLERTAGKSPNIDSGKGLYENGREVNWPGLPGPWPQIPSAAGSGGAASPPQLPTGGTESSGGAWNCQPEQNVVKTVLSARQ